MYGKAHSPNLLLTFIHKSNLSSCEDPDFWIRHIKLFRRWRIFNVKVKKLKSQTFYCRKVLENTYKLYIYFEQFLQSMQR